MILTSLTPDIAWIVPWHKLQQLCHLWRESGLSVDATDRIYFNGDELLEAGFAVNYEICHILVGPNFTALLWGKPQLSVPHENDQASEKYEVFITFAPLEMARVLEKLTHEGAPAIPQLTALKELVLPDHSNVPHQIMLRLLAIGRSPQVQELLPAEATAPNQPISVLLNQRLEQERILNSVTHRIYQNQDVMVVLRMALEQVQQLLRLDRLLVYQLDVSTDIPDHIVNQITFEVLSSKAVSSLLEQEEHLAPAMQQQVREYYQEGNFLTINDSAQATNLDLCVPLLEAEAQPRASLTIPLLVENRLWGLLIAHQCETPRRWRRNETAFLSHVAEYLAIAILQARSYRQLQEQKNSLETLAKQRAKELEDALLSAQVAIQSKKEFIHIMSHELLTPLTSIIGLSNTLSYWSTPENTTKLPVEKQQIYLKTIHESGLKLRNLLQDILDFSQTEAARSFLDLQQFSLKKLS
ncbi:MAG: GAF domain-containing protein, partial [Limnothrix sp.]